MTNREWLESLPNDKLAEFLCDAYPVEYSIGNVQPYIVHWGITAIKKSYLQTLSGVKEWLEKEYEK